MNFGLRGYACFILLLLTQLVLNPTMALAVDGQNKQTELAGQQTQFVIGVTSGEGTEGIGPEAADKLSSYLSRQLPVPVRTKVFKTEEQLLQWLTVFREVDLAWLPTSTLNGVPLGELYLLAQNKASTSLPQGGIVASQVLAPETRAEISTALSSMGSNTSGQDILDQLGIKSFDEPPAPKSVPTRTFSAKGEPLLEKVSPKKQETPQQTQLKAKPVVVSKQLQPDVAIEQSPKSLMLQNKKADSKPAVSELDIGGDKKLIIGFAADSKAIKKSKAATEEISLYLQKQLSMPVEARRFDTEDKLYLWLAQFREVDIAWLSGERANSLPSGKLALLATGEPREKSTTAGVMVGHSGLSTSLQQEISQALVGINQTKQGKETLTQLGIQRFSAPTRHRSIKTSLPKASTQQPRATSKTRNSTTRSIAREPQKVPFVVEPARQAGATVEKQESQSGGATTKAPITVHKAVQKPAEKSQKQQADNNEHELVVGFAANSKGLKAHDKTAESFSDYLQQKLSRPVKARTFDTEENLHRWLFQFREVDIAWLSADRVKALPVGELAQLAQSKELQGDKTAGIIVSHQGIERSIRGEIGQALQEMQEGQQGREILAALGVKELASPTPGRGNIASKQPKKTIAAVTGLSQREEQTAAVKKTVSVNKPEADVNLPKREEKIVQALPLEAKEQKGEAPSPVTDRTVEPKNAQELPPAAVKPEEVKIVAEKVQPGAEEEQSLGKLFGSNEVSVMTSVNDPFIKKMAETQMIGEDLTSRVPTTDLSESIRSGRNFSRDSLAALERTEQAKAQTGQAFGLLLPQVTIRVASGSETSEPGVEIDDVTGELIESDTHERTDTSLTVRQTLFDLPRYFDWRRRQVTEHVRKENQRISDGDAYLATVDSYLSLVSSRLQADVTRSFEDQLAELLEYIEKRASAGAASVSDMARVRARIQATLSSRLEQEAAHATAGIEFVRLTNTAPNTVRMPEPKDIGEALLPKTFDQAVEAAMATNPEVLALATELKAAKIDRKAAKGRYFPRLDAEYTDTYSIGAGGSKDKNGQRDMRLMAVLNWELFSGGKNYQYNIERAARHKELQYRLDDQRRRVVETLSANYTALETTRNRLATSYKELASISTAADAMTKRMLSGKQSLLDLLDVYDRYYQVRSRLVNLHILEMNTISQLVRLTHGAPWDKNEDS